MDGVVYRPAGYRDTGIAQALGGLCGQVLEPLIRVDHPVVGDPVQHGLHAVLRCLPGDPLGDPARTPDSHSTSVLRNSAHSRTRSGTTFGDPG
jgi:hypothetical protein